MAKKSDLAKHRINSSVFLAINTSDAITAGIKFFQSANGVILSPGNSSGVIPAKFIKSATIRGITTLFNS